MDPENPPSDSKNKPTNIAETLDESEKNRYRDLFDVIDTNHDGQIEIDELTFAIKGTDDDDNNDLFGTNVITIYNIIPHKYTHACTNSHTHEYTHPHIYIYIYILFNILLLPTFEI